MSIVPGEYNAATVPELKTIELKEETGPGKRLCRVGAAVTNEEFRRWSVAGKAWAFPADVILVEVSVPFCMCTRRLFHLQQLLEEPGNRSRGSDGLCFDLL